MNMDGNCDLNLAGKSALAEFVCDANDALVLRLVRNSDDADDQEEDPWAFHPEMTHQVFGESEKIFGYRNLEMECLFCAGSLKAFIKHDCDEEIPATLDGVVADPLIPPLLKTLAEGQVLPNEDAFYAAVESDDGFKPMGDKLTEWSLPEDGRTFECYHNTNEKTEFRDYWAKAQPFIMFFIDAASYIDIDDDRWQVFLLFEKYKDDDKTKYALAGFITVYEYYAYPAAKRPRISQMLILPPFQKKGFGSKMLNIITDFYLARPNIVDITVEDPSDEFIRLRDYTDAKNCLTLDVFSKNNLKKGYSEEMYKKANEKFRLCKKQSRKVYEILRLKATNKENAPEYKAYRVDVKSRLSQPYVKQEKQLAKIKKVLAQEEYAAAMSEVTKKETRIEQLSSQYNELEEHYEMVLKRLRSSE